MGKIFFIASALILFSCNQKPADREAAVAGAVNDPHSFSQPGKAVVIHLDLDIKVDFTTQQISGKAGWTINNISKGKDIVFDTKQLQIQKITLGTDERPTTFSLDADAGFMGQALHVAIDTGTTLVNIYYTSAKDAGALQWLTPQQTSGKKDPFLFTQSEPILARTWIPCQDGPGIRFSYNATVTVPPNLMAVMSAENPQTKSADGIYHFKQTHAIPSYLLALAVGDIAFKAIDNRTGIYAEPSVLEKAAWEFADMGKMTDAAEKLYGPYRWGRYDLLVLPPSFPYGGMENPNLTFATPTVIAGDRSLVSLVAHELAHSWSGNLVTNATWNDMWLNEGFTTYFERRIVEALYGREEANMEEVLGRQDLAKTIKEFGDTSADTKLKGNFAGRDPDEASSDIVYEKGAAFLRTIEEAAGREKFDDFLKKYFESHAFTSNTTEKFLVYLNKELIGTDTALADKIKAEDWIYKPGLPANMVPAISAEFNKIDTLLAGFNETGNGGGLHDQIKSTNAILYFISHLPDSLNASKMTLLDKEFGFTNSGNAEVQCAWYTLAVRFHYLPAYANTEKFLMDVGRRKFLKPLYGEMIKTPEGKTWAKQVYAKARGNYHPVAYGTIDEMLK
ncbi:MAG: M1 family metallopeptidase [Chitinophagaceae bacterium]